MDASDPAPDTASAQTTDESTDDQPDEPKSERQPPISRRGALATVVGLGGVGLLSGTVQADHDGPHWNKDVDANDNKLFDLGALAMHANTTEITDFEGENLTIDNGVLNAESVSLWEKSDTSNLLEAPGFDGINVGFVQTPKVGTTDTTAFEGVVADERFLQVAPTDSDDAPNIVAGHPNNTVTSGVVGATIAGGGRASQPNMVEADYGTVGGGRLNEATGPVSTIGGGIAHRATAEFATVGGGADNEASGSRSTIGGGITNRAKANFAAVGGGMLNKANGRSATIAGGESNFALGEGATVPGGRNNRADGSFSFAAGFNADTNGHDGAFVFGDSSSTSIQAQNDDEIRSQMPMYAPSFNTTSARSAKVDVTPVEPQAVLEKVESLSVRTWAFKHQKDGRHMGPMAEAFHDAFGLGDDSEHIATVDADGVAFAAIQGLAERLDEENADLRDDLAEKDDRIGKLERENKQLRERLGTVEDRLADLETSQASSTAADD